MIIILENTNRIIHGILGMVLNLFYFFVSYVYVKEEFPHNIIWDGLLGFIFAVWIFYCFTFGVKWEMKYLEEKAKRIDHQENLLLSRLEEQMDYLNSTIKEQKKDKEKHKDSLSKEKENGEK